MTFYAVDGILTKQKPSGPIETVDLQGRFAVPAFGDAHVHFPSTEQNFEMANRAFLQAGVFYVLNAGGSADTENPLRSRQQSTTAHLNPSTGAISVGGFRLGQVVLRSPHKGISKDKE